MVLVIVASRRNWFIDLEILGIKLEGKTTQVLCRYGEPGPLVPRAIRHRSRLQTAVSCCRPMAVVVNVTEKAQLDCVMCGLERRTQVNHR